MRIPLFRTFHPGLVRTPCAPCGLGVIATRQAHFARPSSGFLETTSSRNPQVAPKGLVLLARLDSCLLPKQWSISHYNPPSRLAASALSTMSAGHDAASASTSPARRSSCSARSSAASRRDAATPSRSRAPWTAIDGRCDGPAPLRASTNSSRTARSSVSQPRTTAHACRRSSSAGNAGTMNTAVSDSHLNVSLAFMLWSSLFCVSNQWASSGHPS